MVFFFHLNWVQWGWTGVQLFFVLSGFLITGILIEMKTHLAGTLYFIKFYGRRFLRIFPLYYFYLLIMLVIVNGMIANRLRVPYANLFQTQFPYALAYVYNFYAASSIYSGHTNFLAHLWSLAVEEQFYIFWPLLIFLVPRKHYRNAFLVVIGLSIVFRMAVFLWGSKVLPSFLAPDSLRVIYLLPFSHLDAFALGALLTVTDIPKARAQFVVLMIGLPILGIVADAIVTGDWAGVANLGMPMLLPYAGKSVWGYTGMNYFFAVLIFGVARLGWFERFLEARPIAYLGKISYGLYVYHFAVIWFLTTPFRISSMKPAPVWNAAAALFVTILIAGLSYRFLEKPLVDLKDRWFAIPPARIVPDRPLTKPADSIPNP